MAHSLTYGLVGSFLPECRRSKLDAHDAKTNSFAASRVVDHVVPGGRNRCGFGVLSSDR